MINMLKNFFSDHLIGALSQSIGSDAGSTQKALQSVLPGLLTAVQGAASGPKLDKLQEAFGGALPTDPSLLDADAMPRIEERGASMVSSIWPEGAPWMGAAREALGAEQGGRFGNMALPLFLGFLQKNNISPSTLGSQVPLLQSALSSFGNLGDVANLGAAGLAGAAAAVTEKVKDVAATPTAVIEQGAPVKETKVAPAPAATVVKEEKKGISPAVWLIPLALAGLAYMATRGNKPAETATTPPATHSAPASAPAATPETPVEGSIVVENIENGAQLPLEPFELSGTAAPEEIISVTNAAGELVATEAADENGKWTTQMPAPLAGENVYTFTGEPSKTKTELRVNGVAAADGAVTTTEPAAATITEPAPGSTVLAETFTLAGTALPNAHYAIYENGVAIGQIVADAEGKWSAELASEMPGERNYVIVDEQGALLAELPLVVADPVVAACPATDDLVLRLADGDTISAPFRFGGLGQKDGANGYLVRVFRGDRQIGQQEINVGANCAWSYLSQPGGGEGDLGEIRYEVYNKAGDVQFKSIILNVVQSGVNFDEHGKYVGPVTRHVH